ncbi:hypothetical protein M3223_01300 [Paenibacillus pasadenensis]|uniref:hypothetical protein n=1 Tax=Paenibacillus pasadenensis TaxID=217090 RepID=UPI00203AB0BE|nr:hypothetical protein [Paenibacillus pasadenensis]MCM3745982.1 hypothetical protein [Paenibacillus pasadenensis]
MDLQPWHYIVLIGALVLVWANLLSRRRKSGNASAEQAPAAGLQQMELALEQFMENMEESQRSLADMVSVSKEQERAEAERREQRIAELEKQCQSLHEELQKQAAAAAPAVEALAVEYSAPLAESSTAQLHPALAAPEPPASAAQMPGIRERYKQLFELYDEGRSIEQIAKRLGMNKGEVMLIQQLARQEEGGNEAS